MDSCWHYHHVLVLILFHLTSGAGGRNIKVYSRAGSDVTIRCFTEISQCSSIKWTYQKNISSKYPLVMEGHVQNGTTFGDDRLRLEPDCSLHISYVTPEDAGEYICHNHQRTFISVDFAVISVFSSTPESELEVNNTMTIQCVLHISNSSTRCSPYTGDFSLEWFGSVPGVHHKWSACNISTELVLTWNQLGRKVHCKLRHKEVERASAAYTVTFPNLCNASSTEGRAEGNVACESPVQMKVLGLTIALITALTVVACAALLVVFKKEPSASQSPNTKHTINENEKAVRERTVSQPNIKEVKEHLYEKVTYSEVDHQNQTHAKRNKRAPEESVWYSTLNTREERKTQDCNLHTVYATAQKLS